jgi:hypothetical protein
MPESKKIFDLKIELSLRLSLINQKESYINLTQIMERKKLTSR